jgi:hypothetical protein
MRGLRGKSLTFSLIFAMAALGFSFGGLMRNSFKEIGFWTPFAFILPLIITGLLAKNEHRLRLRESFQRLSAFLLIFGSIALAICLWRWEVWHEETYEKTFVAGPKYKEPAKETPRRRFGPRP